MTTPPSSSTPGVRVGRRAVLQLPALAALLLALPRVAAARDDEASDPFGAFTDAWQQLADELLSAEAPNEDAYLHRLCGLLADLPLSAVPDMRPVYEQAGLVSGPVWFSGPTFLVELRLDPGAVIRPHNHPLFDVVSVGLSGSCRYRHYEPEPGAPAFTTTGEEFALRQTRSGWLLPGRTTHLSRTRDNVHAFVAGDEGATILDVNTQHPGDGNAFSHLEIGEQPVDAARDLYTARWIGKQNG